MDMYAILMFQTLNTANSHHILFISLPLTGLSHVTHCPQTLGLFNGEDYVFTSSNIAVIDFAKLFLRYGWDVYRLQKVPASVLQDFMK